MWSFVCTKYVLYLFSNNSSTLRVIMPAEEVITKVISEKSLGQEQSLHL